MNKLHLNSWFPPSLLSSMLPLPPFCLHNQPKISAKSDVQALLTQTLFFSNQFAVISCMICAQTNCAQSIIWLKYNSKLSGQKWLLVGKGKRQRLVTLSTFYWWITGSSLLLKTFLWIWRIKLKHLDWKYCFIQLVKQATWRWPISC